MSFHNSRYHSENWSHSNFNSKEIGIKLAESLLGLFDPTLEGVGETSNVDSTTPTPTSLVNEEDEKGKMLIPRYKDAVVELCKLPGMILITFFFVSSSEGSVFHLKEDTLFGNFTSKELLFLS